MPRIRQAAASAKDTHVLMNNCYANYGATNAREIAEMLEASEDAVADPQGAPAGAGAGRS